MVTTKLMRFGGSICAAVLVAACRLSDVDALTRDVPAEQDAGAAPGSDKHVPDASAPHDETAATGSSPNDAAAERAPHLDAGDAAADPRPAPDARADEQADAQMAGPVDASHAPDDASLGDSGGPTASFHCPVAGSYLACETFDYATFVDAKNNPAGPWGWIDPNPWNRSALDEAKLGDNQVLRCATGPSEGEAGRVMLTLPDTFGSVHTEFDFFTESMLTNASVDVMRMQQETKNGYPGVSLADTDEGFYVTVARDDGTAIQYWDSGHAFAPQVSGWVRISMDLVLGMHGSIAIKFDDKTVYMKNDIAVDSLNATSSYIMVGVYAPQKPAFTAYYDNVLISAN